MPMMMMITINRVRHEDVWDPVQTFPTFLIVFIFIETSIYINMKAKAILFLKVKQAEQQ